MSYHRLSTAPLASRHRWAGGGAVDNQQPQGSTYLNSNSVQSNGATSLQASHDAECNTMTPILRITTLLFFRLLHNNDIALPILAGVPQPEHVDGRSLDFVTYLVLPDK